MHRILTVVAFVLAAAGGSAPPRAQAAAQPCDDGPSDSERVQIEALLERNVAELDRTGLLAPASAGVTSLAWPLRAAAGLDDFGYHIVTNFVDRDPDPGDLLDYACEDRTIDGHRGTDIATWPFPWYKMEHDQVEVIAAAAGQIIGKQDGYYDKSCGGPCTSPWNAVYVRHADGSTAWYGHLKKLSLTSKPVGASVAAGEYLGIVGSSGCSSGPHLHFEIYDGLGALVDPSAGPCNTWSGTSWWAVQPPHEDPAVLAIVAGLIAPVIPLCPGIENPNEAASFEPGDLARFTIFYRDQPGGMTTEFRLRRPDGAHVEERILGLGAAPQVKSQLATAVQFAGTAPLGTWVAEVEFDGVLHEYPFLMSSLDAAGRLGSSLRVGKATVLGMPLTWSPDSCDPADARYVVYTGPLDQIGSHWRISSCTDSTSTSFVVTPANFQGNRYYLVVPLNSEAIGSFGLDSGGAERPVGVNGESCGRPQVIACPSE